MSLADERELDLQLGEAREQIKELREKLAECKRKLACMETSIETIRAVCVFSLSPTQADEEKTKVT
jgi:hypothetical protein